MYHQLVSFLFAFVFLQFVDGQDPCSQAIETLSSSYNCDTSSNTICREECLDLFSNIVDNCGSLSDGKVSYLGVYSLLVVLLIADCLCLFHLD